MSADPGPENLSYTTVEDADVYFLATLQGDTWETYSDEDKQKALNAATSTIDDLAYVGEVSDEATLGHAFPRSHQTEVPERVIRACWEEAFMLLQGVSPTVEAEDANRKSHGIASVRSSFDVSVKMHHYHSGFASIKAFNLIKGYLVDPDELTLERV